VHLNFSPVIVHDGWLEQWAELFDQIDAGTNDAAKRQLAAEVIFLTHNEALHEVNLGWHPRGEDLLWRPDLQQVKRSQSGQYNVRYKTGLKRGYVDALTGLLADRMPYCRVRYAF
jgi:spore photoproduct lyase